MMESFKRWWHARTDGVDGIDKLIGASGSPFRERLVKPLGLGLLVAVLLWIAIRMGMAQ